ncbi:MAG: hypothetical protein WCL08_04035 [Verrucomicrobiota bacterium]
MSTPTIHPLKDNVIVRRHIKETSKGGIILPEMSQKNEFFYQVMACGPDVVDLKPLDVVYIHPDAKKRSITLGSTDAWRVNEADVMYKEVR